MLKITKVVSVINVSAIEILKSKDGKREFYKQNVLCAVADEYDDFGSLIVTAHEIELQFFAKSSDKPLVLDTPVDCKIEIGFQSS